MPVCHHSGVYILVLACQSVALSIPIACQAAEWTAEPSVALSREYHDNIRLTTQPHNSINGNILTPKLDLGMHARAWQASGSAQVSRRRYSGESGLDRDNSMFRLSSAYRTERNIWQLDATRASESTITDEQAGSDTGAVQTLKRRETHGVSPSWTRMMTETARLNLAYQLNDTSYINGQSTGLYDFRYRIASATVSDQLSEQNQIFMTGSYSLFHTPATGTDSTTRSVQAGITRNFSVSMQGTLQAGARRTETLKQGGKPVYARLIIPGIVDALVQTGVTQDTRSQETSSVFTGSLGKKYEVTRVNMALSRSFVPSGSGAEIEQDSFDFRLNRTISHRMSAFINLNSFKVRSDRGNISNNGRGYYQVEMGAFWAWSQEWILNTSYRYSHVKREFEDKAAAANSVYLTLTYQPLKTSISR